MKEGMEFKCIRSVEEDLENPLRRSPASGVCCFCACVRSKRKV
jgi:hypothetical protein